MAIIARRYRSFGIHLASFDIHEKIKEVEGAPSALGRFAAKLEQRSEIPLSGIKCKQLNDLSSNN